MKKKLLFLALPILAFLLIGCSNSDPANEPTNETNDTANEPTKKEIESTKSFIEYKKLNSSVVNKKGYELYYEKKYAVSYKSESESQNVEYNHQYDGNGNIKATYDDLGEDEGLKGMLESSSGYLMGRQNEKIISYSKTTYTDKSDRIEDYDFTDIHDFALKFDENDLYLSNSENFVNRKNPDKSGQDSYKGKVDKNIILKYSNEILNEQLEEIVNVNFWYESLDILNLTNNLFDNINLDNEEEIKSLIKKTNCKVTEDDSTISIEFVVSASMYKDGDNKSLNGINSSITIDKSTKDITEYKYDFKDYFLSSINQISQNKKDFTANVDKYVIKGKILNKKLVNLNLTGTFTEYDNNSYSTFLEDYEGHMKTSRDKYL